MSGILQYKKQNKTSVNMIMSILLFLLAMNFMNKFYYIILILFANYILSDQLKLFTVKKNMIAFLSILLFSISYIIVFNYHFTITLVKVMVFLCIPIMYLIGNSIVDKKDYEGLTIKYFLIISLGVYFHGFLNTVYNFDLLRSNYRLRAFPDFWTKNDWIATGQASLFILLIGAAFYIIFYLKFKNNVFLKLFLIFALMNAMYFNIQTATRTIVFAGIFIFVLCWLINMRYFSQNILLSMRRIILIIVLACVFGILYDIDAFHLKTYIENNPLTQRLSRMDSNIENEARAIQMQLAFRQFFTYPLGGAKMDLGNASGFVHNFWLDILYATGIIPLFFMLIFTVCIIRQIITVMSTNRFNKGFTILIFGVHSAVLTLFMVEPVLGAAPWLIALYSFIIGMVDKCIIKSKRMRDVERG